MTVYIGSNELQKAYIGSQEIKQIRVGDKRVFPKGYVPGSNTFLYYSFDGQNLNDNSGNGRNGSRYSGAGSYTTGIQSYGVNNGSRGIKIPSFFNGDFTFSIRVKPTNTSLDPQTLFGTVERANGALHMHSKATNSDRFALAQQGYTNVDASEGFTYGSWNHIVLTRSGNNYKIYKNKNLILTATFTQALNSGFTWLIGNGYNTDRHITGVLDEVIIETVTRSQTEITDYYNMIMGT